MKQITRKIMALIFALMLALQLSGSIVMADEPVPAEQDAAESETDDSSVWDLYTAGVKMDIPEGFTTYKDRVSAYVNSGILEEGIVFAEIDMFLKSKDELDQMNDEQYYEELMNSVPIMLIIGMDGGRGEKEFNDQQQARGNERYFVFEKLGEAGDYTFYEVTYDMDEVEIEDEEMRAIADEIKEQTDEAAGNIVFSEPSQYRTGTRLSFVAEDLDGNEVKSEDIFGSNKITMVNIWTSWCTWCIKEMPELEELNKELNEKGCGIIGIQLDGDSEETLQEGKEVLEMTGVTYLNLKPVAEVTDALLVQAFPTTYFVDSEGYLTGEPVVGADIEAYKAQMETLLAEME